MKYLLLLLLLLLFPIITFSQSKKFIPIDEDTMEFISEVNFILYYKNNPVYESITNKDSVTRLPNNIDFDSIRFYKLNFKEIGLKKTYLKEVVLLSKKIFELDEVVVFGIEKKELIIGEKSRFIKKQSKPFAKNLNYGLLFREFEFKNRLINKIIFFVEKVKHKTTYKIKFYSADESGSPITNQTLQLGKVLFESPILTLVKNTKNKIEIDLAKYHINLDNKNIFVTIELQEYYDENNIQIQPKVENKTKLKFQLSKKTNYYAKMSDSYTKQLTKELINMNAQINYDFAFHLFEKPHKSNLIAPAILLETTLKD